MWIIDETTKQSLNTRTGIVLINKANVDTLRVISGLTQIDLTIEEEVLKTVPPEKICQAFDSLENFSFMDSIQAEQHINEELVNYIEGLEDDRI